jgi:hypothetical protein
MAEGVGKLSAISNVVALELRSLEEDLLKKAKNTIKEPGLDGDETPGATQGKAEMTLNLMEESGAQIKKIVDAGLYATQQYDKKSEAPKILGKPFNASMAELGGAVGKQVIAFLPVSMATRVRNVSFADITGPAKGADGSLPEGQGAVVYEYSDDNHDDLMDALSVLLVKNRPVVLVIFLNPLNAKSDTETQTQADRRGNRWHEGVVFLADMAIAVTEEEAAAGNAIYFTTAFDSPKEAGDATMTALGAVEESYQGKLAAGDFNKDQIAFYFTDGMAAAHLASTHGRLKKGAKHNWHLPAKAVSAPDCLPAYPFFRLLLTCVPAY